MTRAEILAKMRTDDFADRCEKLSKRIDAGFIPTDEEIADALGLPVQFVAAAIALQGLQIATITRSRRFDA